ncbi:MAG: hypothetical protein ABIR17_08410 [Pseudolysinimonas sp.]|uniref:hypothetical protein n=1 Tax=Pseudolysinimonas sp. TaxID=2680009 RepID=UPI003263041C
MTRVLAGLGAAALLTFALVACSAPASDHGSTPPTAASDAPSDAPSTAPVANGPAGCDLVTPELLQSTLGVAAGAAEVEASFTGGPPSCKYADLQMNVQVTTSPDLYLPANLYDGHDLPGSVPVPGADRGYAVDGSLVVVKGGVGVFVTGSYPGISVEAFLALATAIVAEL